MFGKETQAGSFLRIEVIIPAFQLFITAFPCLTGDHINSGVGLTCLYILFGDLAADRINKRNICDIHQGMQLSGFPDSFHAVPVMSLNSPVQFGFIFMQPVLTGNGETGILQAIGNIDRIPLIDLTGTGTAFNRRNRTGTIKRDFSGFQRKGSVIFQQNDAFPGSFPGKSPMRQFTAADGLIRLHPGDISDFHVKFLRIPQQSNFIPLYYKTIFPHKQKNEPYRFV